MKKRKFRFIDLFAGIGGIRLAFEKAGSECVFSCEINPFACQTYEINHKDCPLGDITKMDENNIPEHDILAGGFPCQPFSIAGVSKKKSLNRAHGFLDKTQGTLFFDIARILNAKKPAAFLLENVKNLVSHDRGKTFGTILDVLDEEGYTVHWKIIDARPLVPQHRERIYIVGFRENRRFTFPHLGNRKPVLGDILEERVDDKYTLTDKLWAYLQKYAEKHREKGNGFGFGLCGKDNIARTLSARYYKDGSEILVRQKGKNPRRLTPRECARLMGFPESFQLVVSDTQAYKQFGNTVVVPVVSLIAEQMVKSLEDVVETGTVRHGRPRQIGLFDDMGEVA
jgi:DNA (cytosine-5)-methyltransferase 1